MAYGHAERTLAAIWCLEAETAELLSARDHLDPDEEQWLQEILPQAATDSGSPQRHCRAATVIGLARQPCAPRARPC
jgi:hypothetical protein